MDEKNAPRGLAATERHKLTFTDAEAARMRASGCAPTFHE